MEIVAVTTRKGGAGKTALATGLAACLTSGGESPKTAGILLVDLDLQADASAHLGVEASGDLLRDAIAGRVPLERAILSTPSGIDLAPAGELLGSLCATARMDAVSRALATLPPERYRIVIIDCGPALDRLCGAAWAAAGTLLVPVDGPEALRAASRLRFALEDLSRDSARMRIVLTRFDRRRVLDRALREQAYLLFPTQVLGVEVRESTVFRRAAGARIPLPLHNPAAAGARDLQTLTTEVFDV
jgi:chromosome partitioning protein